MRDLKLRRLFVRYRERDDLDALAAVFEATAPALFALARHLLGSREDAEDAVQQSFLTAIERRASYDAAGPLESWLFGILLRKARRAGERSARRPDPRRVHAVETADPSSDARSAELAATLARAIAELPESYRSVLEPYLHEDERPQEIARRTGVAAGTVRVRLHRGLLALRKALPSGLSASSLAAVASAPELARVRHAVLDAGRVASSGAGAGASGTVALATAGTAASRVLVGVGVVALTTGVLYFAPLRPDAAAPAEPEVAQGSIAAPRASAPGAEPSTLAIESVDASARVAVGSGAEAEAARAHWTLALDVRGLDVLPPGELHLEVGGLRVALTGNGVERVALPPDSSADEAEVPALELRFEHPAFARWSHTTGAVDVRAPGELAVAVALERRFSVISGHVQSDCAAAPSVAYFAYDRERADPSQRFLRPEAQAHCDETGAFQLYVASASGWLVAAAEGCMPDGRWLEWTGIEDRATGTWVLGEGATIEGVAYVEGRAPTAPADVYAERQEVAEEPFAHLAGNRLAFVGDRIVALDGRAITTESGGFRITGLTPGPYGVLLVPPLRISGSSDTLKDGTWVEAPATGIELDTPIHAYTFEVVSEGVPVADATVLVRFGDGGSIAAPTDANGRHPLFLSKNSPAVPVTVSKPGFATLERIVAPADYGPSRVLTLELERTEPASSLRLEFAVAKGAPLGSAELVLELTGADWSIQRTLAPGASTLDVGELPAGAYELRCTPRVDASLSPERQARWASTELELVCRPSEPESFEVALRPAGSVALHLKGFDPADTEAWGIHGAEPYVLTHFLAWRGLPPALEELYIPTELPRDTTVWLRQALLPGDYVLELRHGGEPHAFPFTVVGGELTDVFVEPD